MSLSTDLKTHMTSSMPEVKLHPRQLPQESAMPAMTYVQVSRRTTQDRRTKEMLHKLVRMQFDCYAATYLEAEALAETLVTTLTTWSTYTVLVENVQDIEEPPELERYRVMVEVQIHVV